VGQKTFELAGAMGAYVYAGVNGKSDKFALATTDFQG
jgi:hypothetical protein